jgi:hypothetical protein
MFRMTMIIIIFYAESLEITQLIKLIRKHE